MFQYSELKATTCVPPRLFSCKPTSAAVPVTECKFAREAYYRKRGELLSYASGIGARPGARILCGIAIPERRAPTADQRPRRCLKAIGDVSKAHHK